MAIFSISSFFPSFATITQYIHRTLHEKVFQRNITHSSLWHCAHKLFICTQFCWPISPQKDKILTRKQLPPMEKWYFVSKIALTYCEKKIELLKFEAEGWEFAKILRSLEQFCSNRERWEYFFFTKYVFNLFLEVSQI